MKTFQVDFLGCKVNAYEIEALREGFRQPRVHYTLPRLLTQVRRAPDHEAVIGAEESSTHIVHDPLGRHQRVPRHPNHHRHATALEWSQYVTRD